MPLTAGEVEYILKLRDELTAPFMAAVQQVTGQGTALGDAVKAVSQGAQQAIGNATDSVRLFWDEFTARAYDGVAHFGESVKGAGDHLSEFIQSPLEKTGSALKETLNGISPFTAGLAAIGATAAIAGKELYNLGEHAMQIGENIQDMSEKTGIASPQLSALRGAAEIAGSSLDQVSNAIFMMQRRMAEGGPQFEDGLRRINMSAEELQKMSPDEQFLAIARAIKEIPDPAQRAAAAMELFGRPGRDLLPLLMKNLDELVQRSKDLGSVWTTHDTEAAEALAMDMRALGLAVDNLKAGIGKDLIPVMTTLIGWTGTLGSALKYVTIDMSGLGGMGHIVAEAWRDGAAALGLMSDKFRDLPFTMEELEKKIKANSEATKEQFKASADLTLSGTALKRVEDDLKKTWDDKQEAAKKLREAWDELTGSGHDYDTLVKQLGTDTYESIKYYHDQGAATEKIALALGVTKEQVEGVIRVEKDYQSQLESDNDVLDEHMKNIEANRAANAKAAEGIGKDVTPALRSLGVATGDVIISGKQFNQQVMGPMPDLSDQAARHMNMLRESIETMGKALGDTLDEIPSLLASALTGGGGLAGAAQAIGSTFGTNIGKSIAASIGSSIEAGGGQISGIVGGLLKAIPVVGSFLGPAVSGLMSLFHHGPSEAEIAAQKAYANEVARNVDLFNKLATASDRAQALAGGNADWLKHNIIVTESYVAMGKTGTEALADLTIAVNGVGDAQKAALDRINEATDAYAAQIAEVDAATSRYGFDTEETAKRLVLDWTGLQNKGHDITIVTRQMSSDVLRYLTDAHKVGAEVPASMAPLLTSLSQIGDITDENSAKVLLWGLTAAGASDDALKAYQDYVNGIVAASKKPKESEAAGGGGGGGGSASTGTMVSGGDIWLITHRATDAAAAITEAFVGAQWQVSAMKQKFEQAGGSFNYEYWSNSGTLPAPLTTLTYMAAGGSGTVDKPTLFLAGEAGAEEYAFSGAGKTFGADESVKELRAGLALLAGQMATLNRRLPTILSLAVRDAVVQAR